MLKLLKCYIFYSPAIMLASNLTGSSIFTYCAFLKFLVAAGFFAIRKCHKCGKLFIDFHFFGAFTIANNRASLLFEMYDQ